MESTTVLRRWLIDPQGNPVRQLDDKEIVRKPGHHVAWLPSDEKALELALRIISLLEEMPSTQVAKQLTREGILAPDSGRTRKDNGVRHVVSGVWYSTTIVYTARSMYLIGMANPENENESIEASMEDAESYLNRIYSGPKHLICLGEQISGMCGY